MICVQGGTESGKDGGKKKAKNSADVSGGRAEVSYYTVRKKVVILSLDLVFVISTCVGLSY